MGIHVNILRQTSGPLFLLNLNPRVRQLPVVLPFALVTAILLQTVDVVKAILGHWP